MFSESWLCRWILKPADALSSLKYVSFSAFVCVKTARGRRYLGKYIHCALLEIRINKLKICRAQIQSLFYSNFTGFSIYSSPLCKADFLICFLLASRSFNSCCLTSSAVLCSHWLYSVCYSPVSCSVGQLRLQISLQQENDFRPSDKLFLTFDATLCGT